MARVLQRAPAAIRLIGIHPEIRYGVDRTHRLDDLEVEVQVAKELHFEATVAAAAPAFACSVAAVGDCALTTQQSGRRGRRRGQRALTEARRAAEP